MYYLLPIEQVGNHRGPKYLQWRYGHGLTGRWSLKDFGPVGLVASEDILVKPDVISLSDWSSKQRDTIAAYLRSAGLEYSWAVKAANWREGLHRLTGLILAYQGNDDKPNVWLGREIHFGFTGLKAIDERAWLAEQEVRRITEPLMVHFKIQPQLKRFDLLKFCLQNPLALPFMALPATDAFTSTNGTALTSYSASWTMNIGAMVINTNAVAPNTSVNQSMAHWNADTFGDNQYAQISVAAITNGIYVGPAARCPASGQGGYYIEAESADGFYLYKWASSTETQLGSAAGTIAAGVTLRLETNGTTITPLKNGSTTGTPGAQTDNSVASGYAGINGWGQNTGSRMDDFEGGNLGGTTFNQSATGGFTPAGALVKQDAKILTGATTPAGTILKQDQKVLTGAITPAGATLKQASKPLSGAIVPTGILTTLRTAYAVLTGAIAPVGSLVKQTERALTGAATPVGALLNQAQKVLSGGITPSSTLGTVKTFLLDLAGSIAPSGSLLKQTSKVLVGTIAPVGDLLKQTQQILSGSIAPVGALATVKAFLLDLTGSIAPTGSLVGQAQKMLAGAITPVAGLLKETQKVLTGGITPSGTLSGIKVAFVVLVGAITPSGNLTKETQKFLSGTIAPVGVLAKLVGKLLSGVIMPTGALIGSILGTTLVESTFKGMFRGMFRRMR